MHGVRSLRGRGETLRTGDASGYIDVAGLHGMFSERTRGGWRRRRIYSDFRALSYWNSLYLIAL